MSAELKRRLILNLYKDPKVGLKGLVPFWEAIKDNEDVKRAGVSKSDVKEFISNFSKTLKPPRVELPAIVDTPLTYQADILFFQDIATKNRGYSCILTIVSVRSRKGYAYAMKSKSAEDVLEAFKKFMEDSMRFGMICQLQTDEGKEFENKLFSAYLKSHYIYHEPISSEVHSYRLGLIERFNRTLRDKLTTFMTLSDTQMWYPFLSDIVENYNNTYHTGIKARPVDVAEDRSLDSNLIEKNENVAKAIRKYFPIGTSVRVMIPKQTFEKGIPTFSGERYNVSGHSKYGVFLVDKDGNKLDRTYTARELRRISPEWSTPTKQETSVTTSTTTSTTSTVDTPTKFTDAQKKFIKKQKRDLGGHEGIEIDDEGHAAFKPTKITEKKFSVTH